MKIAAIITAFAATSIALVTAEETSSQQDVKLDQVRWGTVVNEAEFDSSALEGKVVVVEQWGVNCPPCIASLPELAKLARRYESKGLVVVGLEVQGGDKETINELLKDARVKYPVTQGGSIPSNSNGIPHASVFGADGKLVWQGHPADREFERSVKSALRDLKD